MSDQTDDRSPTSPDSSSSEPAMLFDGPEAADVTVVLAHGAGAPMDSPFMDRLAAELAAGDLRVARFEFPYMERRRSTGKRRPPDRTAVLEATWRSVVELLAADPEARRRLVIGGKSMGGRIASRVADQLEPLGLVCLGYPFHPPRRPERLRTAHLADLATPTLILQGERDPFGNREEVSGYRLSPSVRVEWLPDGDHSFKPRKRSGYTEEENLRTTAAAVRHFVDQLS